MQILVAVTQISVPIDSVTSWNFNWRQTSYRMKPNQTNILNNSKFRLVTLALDQNKKFPTGSILSNKNITLSFLPLFQIQYLNLLWLFQQKNSQKSKFFIEIFQMRNRNFVFLVGLGLVSGDAILHMPLDERKGQQDFMDTDGWCPASPFDFDLSKVHNTKCIA